MFNIVVDYICRSLDTDIATNPTTLLTSLIIFYSDDGFLGGSNPIQIQNLTDEATTLLKTIGLYCNPSKTKSMTSLVNYSTGMDVDSYARRYDKSLPSFKQKSKAIVTCLYYQETLQRSSLARHLKFKHCLPASTIRDMDRTEMNHLPREELKVNALDCVCPKDCCPFVGPSNYTLRKHLRSCHPRDTLTSNDLKLSQCPNCLIYLIGDTLPSKHSSSKNCHKHSIKNCRREKKDLNRTSQEVGFTVDDKEMNAVPVFKYLGRPMTQENDDWMAIYYNLSNARQKWGRIRAILTKETSSRKTMENFYKAVVQAVLLYGSETWTLTSAMMAKLNSFHHQCARNICGENIHPDCRSPGHWICPSTITILSKVGLKTISEYITKRKQKLRRSVENSSAVLPSCLKLRNPKPLSWWSYCT